jgi:hypothetical protein
VVGDGTDMVPPKASELDSIQASDCAATGTPVGGATEIFRQCA